eukprot:UN14970
MWKVTYLYRSKHILICRWGKNKGSVTIAYD